MVDLSADMRAILQIFQKVVSIYEDFKKATKDLDLEVAEALEENGTNRIGGCQALEVHPIQGVRIGISGTPDPRCQDRGYPGAA